MVYLALCNVCVGCLDAEYIRSVLFVGDAHVNVFAQLAHYLSGFFLGPQFVPVVQVAGNCNAGFFCSFASFQADRSDIIVERRRDACEVEPLCTVKDFFPVEICCRGSRDGRARTVVDDLGRTLGSSFLQEIDADSVAAARDVRSINAVFSQGVYGCLSDLVFRKLCDEFSVKSIVCKGDSDICLASAVCSAEGVCLYETVVSFRSQS